MQTLELDLNKRYSYTDYLQWFDETRRELFNGFFKLMSPAPTSKHQLVASNIYGLIWNYLRKKKCKAFYAPFDVRLPNENETNDNEIYTVVQPDICVICDLQKIDKRGCLGAPDMIVEIVSENNKKRDLEEKFQIYQQHAVREYWIVLPDEKIVNVFLLNENQKYQLVGMFSEGQIKVNIFDNLYVDFEEIFEE